MDFVIVGAGAVGGVVGTLLEHAGHRVQYWARTGKAPAPGAFELQRVEDRRPFSRIRSEPLQWLSAAGAQAQDALPTSSGWVIVCVRSEQLAAALAEVAQRLGPQRAVAIATVTLDGARAAATDAGLRGPVLAFHVAFGSEPIGPSQADVVRLAWFPFSAPSVISTENEASLGEAAATLARALSSAGLPARAVRSVSGWMRLFVLAGVAFLTSWELCAWDNPRLARDRELRALTARAMRETVRRFAPERGILRLLSLSLPQSLYASVLWLVPRLMPRRASELWRVHGPKISEQTGFMLRELLERAEREGAPLAVLPLLAARRSAAHTARNPAPQSRAQA